MIPFAFYGRVSTEDQQDPEASRAWQLHRSRQLIEPLGGVVVAEYFDIAQSRSVPWKRRPEASRLLGDFRNEHRGFAAVVIGEPQRAFYGNQFGLTFPVFTHFGIALWVPEVGGAVDPGSEAHDLVMTLFGGMSKGERMRIKTRVRAAMASQTVTEGRFLGGRPPYGYRLVDAGPHPKPDKAATGMRIRKLEADPETGPIVQRIFAEFLEGHGYYAIAERLTGDGIESPSGRDRQRNSHRLGIAWGKTAVRAILLNPRYTGYQVWNKQRKDEILMDVEDVAAGHQTVMRWNQTTEWVWSSELAHESLVSREVFEDVQALIGSRSYKRKPRKGRPDTREYALRGRVWCAVCERKLQGSWNHNEAYYRCRYADEYATSRKLKHPKNVYLREGEILQRLNDWLTEEFAPDNLDALTASLTEADKEDLSKVDEIKSVETTIAENRKKLNRYRDALETGTEPELVMQWIAEVTAAQATAESRLRALKQETPKMSGEEVREILEDIGALAPLLIEGDSKDRSDFYEAIDLKTVYNPNDRKFTATASARGVTVRVGERT